MLTDTKMMMETSDREVFEVDVTVASQSQIIKAITEDTGTNDTPIFLPNVSSKTLAKVLEYCRYHAEAQKCSDEIAAIPDDQIKLFDTEFTKVDKATLFDILEAANYLHIQDLFLLTCQAVAGMIKCKTRQEIRDAFGIKSSFETLTKRKGR